MTIRHALAAVCLLLAAAEPAAAQEHRLVEAGDWPYEYVSRLQRRGHLLTLHPTALPYTAGEVRRALADVRRMDLSPIEARWVALLEAAFTPAAAHTVLGGAAGAGLTAVNSDRRSTLRFSDAGAPTLPLGPINVFPEAVAAGHLEHGRLVARLGLRFDLYYRDDPDGLDAANRLVSRNAGYLGYDGPFASVYLGRFDQHWSLPGEAASMVSANTAPFDRLALRLGGDRLALRSILGELDSITADGRFTGKAGADSVGGSERRFLAAHRLDWRPSPRVAVSITEANLFSGAGAGVTPRHLNPLLLHAFLVDGLPKNDENNGLLGGLLWLQHRRLTLQGQLMVDDFDFLSETGEPASLALMGTATYAPARAPADVGVRLTVVSARAYNTHQPEGRYVYLQRGLATQFSDYVEAAAFVDVYADAWLPGLIVTPEATLLAQGVRDLRQPYPRPEEAVGFVLDGTPERTLRLGMRFFFQRDPRFWLRADVGLNVTSDAGFVSGERATRFVGLVSFGTRVDLYRPFDLNW